MTDQIDTTTTDDADAGSDDRAVRWHAGDDGVATIVLDDPAAPVNTMTDRFRRDLSAVVTELASATAAGRVRGVLVTSGKDTFFAGGNLERMQAATADDAAEVFAAAEEITASLRRLETLGVPVVAVLGGTALGGGLEIALACHHRVVVDRPDARFGLPEVTLGLLPGGGGVTRTVRMLGIEEAVTRVLGEGRRFRPGDALEVGLVDELVGTAEAAEVAARSWITENPAAGQPWDQPGFRIPGGTPSSPRLASQLPAFPANLRKTLRGAPYPAPRAILAAAVEGAQVDLETATRIESRYLVELMTGQVASNMIQAFFYDLQAINRGHSRPDDVARTSAHRVAVLGAGMMGAGIAHACATSGLEVGLKDVSQEAAEAGRDHVASLLDDAVERGRTTRGQADEALARVSATAAAGDLDGADVVVEAVFEDVGLKQQVFAEALDHVADDALLCTNTSTLPITELASGIARPADVVGLHFFSPVHRMPLIEIIRGEATSDRALARAFDLARALGKTPIVVEDARGFFTSRVIGVAIDEGLRMLAEGVAPPSIERASTQAGYPVGTLQLADELNLELMAGIRSATQAALEAEGTAREPTPADDVIDRMLELGRPGRRGGAGFHDYDDGARTGLWSGLAQQWPVADEQPAMQDLQDRLLFVEAIESVRCLDEGVVASIADANVGSLLGIGYPGWTGGVLQYVDGFDRDGHERGPAGFVARADELAAVHGDRFTPTASLRRAAETGSLRPHRSAVPA